MIVSKIFKFISAILSKITNRTQFATTGCDKHLMEKQCAFSATHQFQEDTLQFKCMEKESCPCVKSLLIQGLVEFQIGARLEMVAVTKSVSIIVTERHPASVMKDTHWPMIKRRVLTSMSADLTMVVAELTQMHTVPTIQEVTFVDATLDTYSKTIVSPSAWTLMNVALEMVVVNKCVIILLAVICARAELAIKGI